MRWRALSPRSHGIKSVYVSGALPGTDSFREAECESFRMFQGCDRQGRSIDFRHKAIREGMSGKVIARQHKAGQTRHRDINRQTNQIDKRAGRQAEGRQATAKQYRRVVSLAELQVVARDVDLVHTRQRHVWHGALARQGHAQHLAGVLSHCLELLHGLGVGRRDDVIHEVPGVACPLSSEPKMNTQRSTTQSKAYSRDGLALGQTLNKLLLAEHATGSLAMQRPGYRNVRGAVLGRLEDEKRFAKRRCH